MLRQEDCHHDEGFSPTKDLLFAAGSRSLAAEAACDGNLLVRPSLAHKNIYG